MADKYLTQFESIQDLNNYITNDYEEPFVSYVDGKVYYNRTLPDNNGHSYVDLGLPSGTLWATQNVGQSNEALAGDYYAWGNIETHYESLVPLQWKEGKENGYVRDNDNFYSNNSYSKYNSTDNKTILDLEDDVANVMWGGNWRIPTAEQWTELDNCCEFETFSKDSITIKKCKSKINGNFITFVLGENLYWYSDDYMASERNGTYCCEYSVYSTYVSNYGSRYEPHLVRPVIKSQLLTVPTVLKGPFAGYYISQGPLYYNGTNFEIKNDWKISSYGNVYGINEGSTYFNISELDNSFGMQYTNKAKINGWSPLSEDTAYKFFASGSSIWRFGSYVNGERLFYSTIKVVDVNYANETSNGIFGSLLFPDYKRIEGVPLNSTGVTSITENELNKYLAQGCIFFPECGYFDSNSNVWTNINSEGIYWISGGSLSSTHYAMSITNTPQRVTANSENYCQMYFMKPA